MDFLPINLNARIPDATINGSQLEACENIATVLCCVSMFSAPSTTTETCALHTVSKGPRLHKGTHAH